MIAALPFMPTYVMDYDVDTRHLTCEQDGAYWRILRRLWMYGDIPNDDHELASVCRVKHMHWVRNLKPAVMPFLTVNENGTVTQKRLTKEREKALEICGKKSKAALAMHAKHRKIKPVQTDDVNEINGMLDARADADILVAQAHVLGHVQEHRQEREEAIASSGSAVQPSLIPEDSKPPVTKPLSPYRAFQAEAIPILAGLMGKDAVKDAKAIGTQLNKIRTHADLDDDLVMSVLRAAALMEQKEPFGWIMAQIGMKLGKARKGDAPKPELVVDNDPTDLYGVNAWCKARGFTPAEGPDLRWGKWVYKGWVIDFAARRFCEAAAFPGSWRGDLDTILEWADSKQSVPDVVESIKKAIARCYQTENDYRATNLKRFRGWVMQNARTAA